MMLEERGSTDPESGRRLSANAASSRFPSCMLIQKNKDQNPIIIHAAWINY
jgi:hypothetical protein